MQKIRLLKQLEISNFLCAIKDANDADWKNNPIGYKISTIEVTAKSKIKLNLSPGGGTAISFKQIN